MGPGPASDLQDRFLLVQRAGIHQPDPTSSQIDCDQRQPGRSIHNDCPPDRCSKPNQAGCYLVSDLDFGSAIGGLTGAVFRRNGRPGFTVSFDRHGNGGNAAFDQPLGHVLGTVA